jgi:hypothetical protein
MLVLVQLVPRPATLPGTRALDPWTVPKPAPVIVTAVPARPLDGVMLEMAVAAAARVE